MSLSDQINRTDRRTSAAPQPERQPLARWRQLREDRLVDRERRGGSRFEAVADTTGLVTL